MIQSRVSAKTLIVRIEYNFVLAEIRDPDAVVSEALGGMKVENKHQTGSVEHDNLVSFVFRANEGLKEERNIS